ncbi:protein NETWORKED 1A [Brachypodium distachyon]|uniref:NAB domain-containing protein n=1 Tax=Brachypodium distachyon TaxID=15368 RepID=I1IMZ9_BRADI|nr:protein NETWORKED 1A [Brachypodium distachyon]XP_024318845.1 protein NETWORKED 1A [Brachypodium distachyon]KQJ89166.1 hypothetical protein BRADI_4g23910v3 [Brachypodium distachyon]|eukprot:XP_003577773.1 protein NETWORKED 1A [Brachypodium distachyon]
MAATSPTIARRKYSWWWDSHICPKNSKWLQLNLEDMDSKIKLMIKIIEEDAESFAKRAEMYYRRRPELMTLLEELYRAYRALAERYDHAAGELRQAHRKIAEAFPDQVLLDLDDDLPVETTSIEKDLQNPDLTSYFLSLFNASESKGLVKDDQNYEKLQKELVSLSQENQELKNRISSVLERSNNAESEVLRLKEDLAQQEAEKEAAVLQCQQSTARLENLKSEILYTQEQFSRLKEEMQTGLLPLSTANERFLMLERANQDLHLELEKLKHLLKQKHDELNEKQAELENVNISREEEHLKCMQAEMVNLSLEKQFLLAQDRLSHLVLEKQSEAIKIKDIETSKFMLQKELEKILEDNKRLNDQHNSSSAVITHLHDEIILMKDAQHRLKEEACQHVDEKKTLQYELSHLKDDRSDLERKHFSIKEQIESVNLNVESLHDLAQELRDGNFELKEVIKNHKSTELLHTENLRQLEKMSEKNAHLEKSLAAANTDLEGLREKKVALEESCKELNSKICSRQSERAVLVAQIEAISQTLEGLLKKNVFLENSLSDANVELENLRTKLKELEESSEAVHNQNSILGTEKRTLVCQVDNISGTLLNLEVQYTELERRHTVLQQEKDTVLDEVIRLQEQIRFERKEHKHASKTQFDDLEKQVSLLLEEGRNREEQLEEEELKIAKAQVEIFILKQCLHDMADANSDLSAQLQKKKEVCKVQEEKLDCLSLRNEKLTEGIGSVLKVLHLDEKYESLDQMKPEIIVQLILHEIHSLCNTISDAQDVKQNELVEKSLVVTLLEHLRHEVADLRSERNILKQDQQEKSKELLQLQSERLEIMKISNEFWEEMEARNHRVDELRAEAKFLVGQLSELQDSRRSLQNEIIKLIQQNSFLSDELKDSREKQNMFEDDFSTLISDAVSKDILVVIFRSLHEERALQLKSLHNDFACIQAAGSELCQDISMLNKNLGDIEIENNHLGKDLNGTMNIHDRSSAENASEKGNPACRDNNLISSGKIRQDYHVSMEVEQQKDVDISGLDKSNEMLQEEVLKLKGKVEVLRSKDKTLIDIKSCDEEIKELMSNMQMAIMNAALFKEKVLELIITCESFEISSMVQKEVLKEDITRRNSYVDELKDKLNAIENENRRLKVDLNGDFTMLGSLQAEVSTLEKQTMSLANDCLQSNKLRIEENALSPEPLKTMVSSDHNAMKMVKEMELQKLHGTIKALQKMVTDAGVLLEQERLDFSANLQEARKQIEVLKLKEILDDDLTEMNYEKMLKDIQLDLIQTCSGRRAESVGQEKKNVAPADDKVHDVRGIIGPSSNHIHEDLRPPQSESLEKDNSKQSPADLMVVKELGVDKQELPRSITREPHQEWKNKVIERLSSDAQRLNTLQSSIQDLKTNTEASEEHELESVRYQIREAEGTIMQLIDTNSKLSKKAEEFTSADGLEGDNIDLRSRHQRKILERARKMSEKIGRLELEMQKVQQALLKYEEQSSSRSSKTTQRRSKVQLVEYLYGRRPDSRKQKRCSPCGCMRAKTIDD